MNISEMSEKIKSNGMFPIPVIGEAEQNEDSGKLFSGSLDDYFEAAKALGASAIFIYTSSLDEAHFVYDPDSSDEAEGEDDEDAEIDDDNDIEQSIDLTTVLPSLIDFKKYIGHNYAISLTAKSQVSELYYYLEDNWWNEFSEQWGNAVEEVDDNLDDIREKNRKSRIEKEKAIIKQVRQLITDPVFCSVTTQRAMKAYAIEKYPDLGNISDATLKDEIQHLCDKIRISKKKNK